MADHPGLPTYRTAQKLGRDVEPGNAIVFMGVPHVVTEIVPSSPATLRILPGSRLARSGDWCITLDPNCVYEVLA